MERDEVAVREATTRVTLIIIKAILEEEVTVVVSEEEVTTADSEVEVTVDLEEAVETENLEVEVTVDLEEVVETENSEVEVMADLEVEVKEVIMEEEETENSVVEAVSGDAEMAASTTITIIPLAVKVAVVVVPQVLLPVATLPGVIPIRLPLPPNNLTLPNLNLQHRPGATQKSKNQPSLRPNLKMSRKSSRLALTAQHLNN